MEGRNGLLLAHRGWHRLHIVHWWTRIVLISWDIAWRIILPHFGDAVLLIHHLLSMLIMHVLILHSWVTLVECKNLFLLHWSVKAAFIVHESGCSLTSGHGKLRLTIEMRLRVLHHLILSHLKLLLMGPRISSRLTECTRKLAHWVWPILSHIYLFTSSLAVRVLGYSWLTHIINWSVCRIAVIISGTVELLSDLDWHWRVHLLVSSLSLGTKSFTMVHLLRVLLLHWGSKLGWHAHHFSLHSDPLVVGHLLILGKFVHIHLLMHLLLA
jgi:hypothetical protein